MKQFIKSLIVPAALIAAFGFVTLSPQVALAAPVNPGDAVQDGIKAAGSNASGQGQINKGFRTVVNVLLFVIGAVAVIMIIIGGLRYTISNGDSGQITSAKNTILYAVIGLIVAVLAYAIVNFVVDAFTKP